MKMIINERDKIYGDRSKGFRLLPFVYAIYTKCGLMFNYGLVFSLWCIRLEVDWNTYKVRPRCSFNFIYQLPDKILEWESNDDGTRYLVKESYWL